MDCSVMGGQAAGPGRDAFAVAAASAADAPAKASLCMTCSVRDRCIGGVAAEAGTRELLAVLAGRRLVRAGEVVQQPGSFLRVVRSGSFKSIATGAAGTAHPCGLHFPGEVISGGRSLQLVALEDSELCVMRCGVDGRPGLESRTCLGRLWDMVSRELLRERAQASRLAALHPVRRITAFLASLAVRARVRGASPRGLRLHLSEADIAGFLGVPPETVGRVLEVLAKREVLLPGPRNLVIVNPELLQRAAGSD